MVMDETDVQSPEQEMVQAIHAEWVQEVARCEERTDACPRTGRSSGPQRKVCRKQGGSCGQTTRQDGARAD